MLTTHRIVVATVNSEKFEVFEHLLASERDIVLARADTAIRNPEKLRFAVDWRRPCLENTISKARLLGQASHSPVLSETACIEMGDEDDRIIIPDDDLDLCYSIRVGGSPLAQVTWLLNSIFIPQGEYRTLAEMSQDDRSRYSPRDRAVRRVMKEMAEDGLILVKPQAG